ncbi:hypothetical protein VSY18_22780 [Bacillus albus]|uniref:hypothetical protein n=1 Tax=Bacillus TaxID=1386 RepID=UPI0020013FD5|nr:MULTISPECIES: hypothetical protein [Bacillus]MDA2025017.1 hypothetical protein [Bacillus cereus group sp. Bcc03]MDA2214762.1 hypothetical protein [Bacillus cereus group sp. Bc228]MDA2226718.1 hypothetical protein [Bacillus cereus group sp. Bc227]MDA2259089.1 hypothetical protein [Bacillus cereus group sp. Bc200]MDA2325073.1 hypothetical protein [Bacillus cereus group sp. Bc177]
MSFFVKRGWIAISIDMEIIAFEKYIEEMESFIKNQLHELNEQYEKQIEGVSSDEEKTHIFEYQYEDQFYHYKNEFPNILRKSFIISLYSFLEQNLKKICKHLEKKHNLKPTFASKIEKAIVQNCYEYLNETAKVDLNIVQDEWGKIRKINKIRNHFVHDGNDVLDKILKPRHWKERRTNQILNAFIHFNLATEDKKYTDIGKPTGILKYEIQISDEFCRESLNIIKSFFEKLTCTIKLY